MFALQLQFLLASETTNASSRAAVHKSLPLEPVSCALSSNLIIS